MATMSPTMTSRAHDAMMARTALASDGFVDGTSDDARRARGLVRAAQHNLALHIEAQKRRHGGYQDPLPL